MTPHYGIWHVARACWYTGKLLIDMYVDVHRMSRRR